LYTHPIASSPSKEYVNCGGMLGESCTRDDDCSFKSCGGVCNDNHFVPSDTDVVTVGLQQLHFEATLIIIILILIICCWCCCYCFVKRH